MKHHKLFLIITLGVTLPTTALASRNDGWPTLGTDTPQPKHALNTSGSKSRSNSAFHASTPDNLITLDVQPKPASSAASSQSTSEALALIPALALSPSASGSAFNTDSGTPAIAAAPNADIVPKAVQTTAQTSEGYLSGIWTGLAQVGAGARWLSRLDSEEAREQLCNEKNKQLQTTLIDLLKDGTVDIDALTRETRKRQEAENLLFPLMFANGEFNVHQDNRTKVLEIINTWTDDFPPILATAALLYLKKSDLALATTQEHVQKTNTALTSKPANYLPALKSPALQPQP